MIKISNVGVQLSAVPTTSGTVTATGGAETDFAALLMQLFGSAELPPSPTLAAAVSDAFGKHDAPAQGEEDAATSELAMLMAALTPGPATLPTTQTAPPPSGASDDVLSAPALNPGRASLAEYAQRMLTQQAALGGTGESAVSEDVSATAMDALLSDASSGVTEVRPHSTGVELVREARVPLSGGESTITRHVHTPVGHAAWADELGTQVNWMSDRGHHSASIRLTPEHLGPLEVRISIEDDRASVWFGASHADTRAAIENALPRLREMLASEGLSLNDAGVFREPPQQQQRAQTSPGVNGDVIQPAEQTTQVSTSSVSLIDAYA